MRTVDRQMAGFTLIEMLVALAIMGLGAGIAFPAIERLAEQRALDEAASVVQAALVQARADALSGDHAAGLVGGGQRLGFTSGRAAIDLPEGVSLLLPRGGITFYPDGTSGGGIASVSANGVERRFSVDPNISRIAPLR